nr:MAG TPA: hypothetical protein [Caudoviricetes sp.]
MSVKRTSNISCRTDASKEKRGGQAAGAELKWRQTPSRLPRPRVGS